MSITTKQRPIKAVTNFRRRPAESVVTASTVVQDHMKDNSNFSGAPAPPVDMPALKAATDLLAAKIAAAADGGKTAIAEKNHQKEVVAKLLVQLAHYVEANCKDDITIFLSSGFTPAASTKNTTPPVSESIRKTEQWTDAGHADEVSGRGQLSGAMGAGGCRRRARLVDDQAGRSGTAASAHLRFDSRHDLRVSGACCNQDRLLRLE